MIYGLIGEHLGHSFSAEIHARLGGEPYELRELPPDRVEAFLREGGFRGINVTIPYKQAVIPFLDEISEIPLVLQSRLLRVIQEREVRRVGANRVIPINVRIICATNRDLLDMIRQGRFREDLYYRLKVLSVQLPPLRDRGDDITMIMQHYLNYYTRKFGKEQIALSADAAGMLRSYSWPGNIRELRNFKKLEQLAGRWDEILAKNDRYAILWYGIGQISRDEVFMLAFYDDITAAGIEGAKPFADLDMPIRWQSESILRSSRIPW